MLCSPLQTHTDYHGPQAHSNPDNYKFVKVSTITVQIKSAISAFKDRPPTSVEMAQSDFASLAAHNLCNRSDARLEPDDSEVCGSVSKTKSAGQLAKTDTCLGNNRDGEVWISPVLAIPEISFMGCEVVDHASIRDHVVEPTRRLRQDCAPPPKRFFRSVWRSAARRLLSIPTMAKHTKDTF